MLLQLPSVSVVLRDDAGRVLLARHSETHTWGFPGGSVEPGETPADAAVREMWEETGLFVRLTRLVGVFGGPEHIIRYKNGDRTSYVSSTFEAALDSGTMRLDAAELLEVRFVSSSDAAQLAAAPWVPEILRAVFEAPREAAFRPATWRPHSSPGRETS